MNFKLCVLGVKLALINLEIRVMKEFIIFKMIETRRLCSNEIDLN